MYLRLRVSMIAFAWDEADVVDSVTVAPRSTLPPPIAHVAAGLPELEVHDAEKPAYEGPLGAYFEKEWIKGAREVRRREMLDAPNRPRLVSALEADTKPDRPLDLIDWESQIIFNTE
jgi:hypothetical protein